MVIVIRRSQGLLTPRELELQQSRKGEAERGSCQPTQHHACIISKVCAWQLMNATVLTSCLDGRCMLQVQWRCEVMDAGRLMVPLLCYAWAAGSCSAPSNTHIASLPPT